MNKQLRRLGLGLILCYAVLFVQLNWLQVVKADSYNKDPNNTRAVVRDFTRPRGLILTADGQVLAQSVPVADRYKELRQYPLADIFGEVTGYFSFKYGTAGVEAQYNEVLAGQTAQQELRGFSNLFSDDVNTGDVVLTLRADIQRAAKDALGDKEGSVVVMDPHTGAILAMYSNPSYDPNALASHDFAAVDQARAALLADPRNPLLFRAYQERYMTGSTFKIITATAALQSGQFTLDSNFPPTATYKVPARSEPIKNYSGEVCGGSFSQVFALSCNTSFAQMGIELGPEKMVAAAESFGFNDAPPIDLPRPAKPFFPSVADIKADVPNGPSPKLAVASFGQDDTSATPIEMAMAASAVANGGTIMVPHVMVETRDSDGTILDKYQPKPWKQPMDAELAATLNQLMVGVVRSGTARCCLQLANGIQAAAKTGTAQLGTNPPLSHAWITSFAPADNPRVVVTVFVKATPEVSTGVGATVAGPVAKKVLDMVMALPDPLVPQQ
jgi:peptidoglycan glycosyltransferase